jgi:hypothetical protein
VKAFASFNKLVVPMKEYRRPSEKVLDEFKAFFGIEGAEIGVSTVKERTLRSKNRDVFSASKQTDIYLLSIPREVEYGLVFSESHEVFRHGIGSYDLRGVVESLREV